MDNFQWYPFERNRYFQGKMLTSADFQAEQAYMNDKRWFLNRLMFGSGIVYGMSVFNLDDLSILVESGAAIDDLGREIVIDSSVVRKMSAISGFEQVTEDKVSLCVRYREEETRPVYSIHGQEYGREYEFNHISEGYELFLKNTSELEQVYLAETEFLLQTCLFENQDYQVQFWIPAMISQNTQVRMMLRVGKKSSEDKELNLKCIIQLPTFLSLGDSHEIAVEWQGLISQQGSQVIEDYWLKANENSLREGSVLIKPGTLHVLADGEEQEISEQQPITVKLVLQEPEELIQRELGKNSLEMQELGTRDYVRLADFQMVQTENAYIIDTIEEEKAKTYIPAPGKMQETSRYLSFFKPLSQPENIFHQLEKHEADRKGLTASSTRIARGSIELPLGVHMKKGEICYSEEIIHGLGKGNVYIAVGTKLLEENAIIYGEPSLFEDQQEECTNIQTAVKVFQDRGSFQVAARLIGEQKSVVVVLNWIGIRFSIEPRGQNFHSEGSIVADTPTAVLKPREKYYFHVHFQGMEPCRLRYEMSEEGSGTIDQDGLYIAPGTEGIFEICISNVENANVVTYAYAVVKK